MPDRKAPEITGAPIGTESRKSLQDKGMETKGIERTPLALSKTPISQTPSAKSGARDAPETPKDPDLALIQERWPTLPEHIRQAVLALVKMQGQG